MATDEIEVDTRFKVGRVLESYELLDLHDELPALWLGEVEEEPLSLRDIAVRINQNLVDRAMSRAGTDPLEGEAANVYQLLTDTDVSAGIYTQQRNRLDRIGVDIESLEDDFVTHQAVHTYLTEALGVSKPTIDDDPVAKHEQRIKRMRSRTQAVIEDSLGSLEAGESITLRSPDVVVDFGVYCHDCGTHKEFTELLANGGCNCP